MAGGERLGEDFAFGLLEEGGELRFDLGLEGFEAAVTGEGTDLAGGVIPSGWFFPAAEASKAVPTPGRAPKNCP